MTTVSVNFSVLHWFGENLRKCQLCNITREISAVLPTYFWKLLITRQSFEVINANHTQSMKMTYVNVNLKLTYTSTWWWSYLFTRRSSKLGPILTIFSLSKNLTTLISINWPQFNFRVCRFWLAKEIRLSFFIGRCEYPGTSGSRLITYYGRIFFITKIRIALWHRQMAIATKP